MADRIAILDKGEVMQVATPAEVYEAPGSRYVASFVGNINMFEGTIGQKNGSGVYVDVPGEGAILAESGGDIPTGTSVAFAIRPEKISVSRRPEPGLNALEGEIFDIAYLGDMTVFHVKLPSGQVVKASVLNARRVSDEPLTWQDKAWISFRPDAGVLLTR